MKSHRVKAPLLLRWPLRRAVEPVSAARRWLDRADWFAAPLALLVGVLPLPIGGRIVGVVLVALAFALAVVLRARPRRPPGWIIVDPNGIARHRPSGDAPSSSGPSASAWWSSPTSPRRGVSSPSRRPSRRATSRCALPATTTRRRRGSSSRAGRRSATWTWRSRRSMGTKRSLRATRWRSSPRCARTTAPPIDRILLSDPRGAAVVLEGNELRAGDRVIDLTAPLEWRAFLFLESAGPLGAVVQATWVRQAGTRGRARRSAVRYARAGASRRAHPVDPRRPSSHRAPHGNRAPLHGAVPYALDRAPRASRSPTPAAELSARRRARPDELSLSTRLLLRSR